MLSSALRGKLSLFQLILSICILGMLVLNGEDAKPQDPLKVLYDEALTYYSGDGVSQDFDEAARLFKSAARKGHAPSQNMFGYLHSTGQGARKSWNRAAYWWKLSADQDYIPALYNMSTLYLNGWGVKEDTSKAIEYLKRVVEPQSSVTDSLEDFGLYSSFVGDACFRLGSLYRDGKGVKKDLTESAKWMHQAAVEGHMMGIIQSGLNYALAEGVEENPIQANLFFNMALAEMNNYQGESIRSFYIDGISDESRFEEEMDDLKDEQRKVIAGMQSHVGTILYDRDDNPDPDSAMNWLEMAAEGGDPVAMTYLATHNYLNAATEEAKQAAHEQLKEAAELEVPLAQYNYGVLLAQEGQPAYDPDQATRYIKSAARSHIYPAILAVEAARQGQADPTEPPSQVGLPEHGILTMKELAALTQEKAHSGDMTAAACYGYMLYMGMGVKEDEAGGMAWIRQAASTDNTEGQALMGYALLYGWDGQSSPEEALKYFEMAADKGDYCALFTAALLYDFGFGYDYWYNKKNKNLIEFYERCAQEGITGAYNNLALCYLYGDGVERDTNRAIEYLEKAAEEGESTALSTLGDLYNEGRFVPQNFKKARQFYERAIEIDDNANSHLMLGNLYRDGNGVDQVDLEQAAIHFHKAAQQGNGVAAGQLGLIFSSDDELNPDYPRALRWLDQAFQQGYGPAGIVLASLYEQGLGTEVDYNRSFNILERFPRDYVDENLQFALGRAYLFGRGTKSNTKKAKKYFEQGFKLNRTTGNVWLGVYYDYLATHSKKNSKKNLEEAQSHFQTAINYGSVLAKVEFAKRILEGRYQEHTTQYALQLLDAASTAGNPEAKYLLAKAYEDGIEGAPDIEKTAQLLESIEAYDFPGANELYEKIDTILNPPQAKPLKKKSGEMRAEYGDELGLMFDPRTSDQVDAIGNRREHRLQTLPNRLGLAG